MPTFRATPLTPLTPSPYRPNMHKRRLIASQFIAAPKPQLKDVSRFQGMTLQNIENHICGLSNEELFAAGKGGSIIATCRGTNNSVVFPSRVPEERMMQDDVTVTHGHPKGAEGYGGAFSPKDILNMTPSNRAEHCAAGDRQGRAEPYRSPQFFQHG